MRRRVSLQWMVLAGVVVSSFLLPTRADAQQVGSSTPRRPTSQAITLELTPFLGMYVPLGSLVADSMVRLRPVGALAAGSRIAAVWSERFALEGSIVWSPNLVAQSDWKQTLDLEGGFWAASLKARVRIASPQHELVWSVSPGVALLQRYGSAWRDLFGTADVGLVLGGAARYHAGNSLELVFDFENYVTRTGYVDRSGLHYGGHLHHDLIWSVGATINLF
jgi:hypothetical protein